MTYLLDQAEKAMQQNRVALERQLADDATHKVFADSLFKAQSTRLATAIRKGTLAAIYHAGSGHPGGSLSIADILATIYNLDDKAKLVLSKGHACPALYALRAVTHGDKAALKTLRKLGSPLQGHPDVQRTPWIETSTGSLGQGFSVATGMALAYRTSGTRVYVILGDGELQEGEVWEAAMFAGHYGLSNLCAVVDYNRLQTHAHDFGLPPLKAKWDAFGWFTLSIDGHDLNQIADAIKVSRLRRNKPTCIIANTVKGKGVSFMEGKPEWHGSVKMTEQETAAALAELGATEEEIREALSA